jgi:hypothetical protein
MVKKSIFFYLSDDIYAEGKELRQKYKVSHKAIYIAGMALLKRAYEGGSNEEE